AVAHNGLEGVGLPLLTRTGGDDIRMTSEAQHRPSAAMPRPEIFDRAERHALDAEAVCLQALANELQAAVILGADGRAADQVLGEGERGVGVGRQSQEPPKAAKGRCGRGLIAKTLDGGKPLLLRAYDKRIRSQLADWASPLCRVTRMSSKLVTLPRRWKRVKKPGL